MEQEFIWKDRKRTIFGLPWSFTRYYLTDDKLIIDKGFFTRSEDEIRLYRITDITLKRTLADRLNGVGTIHCCSADKTSPEFDIAKVKNARKVKDVLSDMIEKEREKHRVIVREDFGDDDDCMRTL